MELKPEELGYLAATIDGEGTIGLYRHGRYFSPIICFNNTNLQFIHYIMSLVGGTLTTAKRDGDPAKRPNSRPCYTLWVSKQASQKEILLKVTPLLHIKKRQAELLSSFYKANNDAERLELVIQMKDANSRGNGRTGTRVRLA